jgi:hypothetical protein
MTNKPMQDAGLRSKYISFGLIGSTQRLFRAAQDTVLESVRISSGGKDFEVNGLLFGEVGGVQFLYDVFAIVDPPYGSSISFAFKEVNFDTILPGKSSSLSFSSNLRTKGKRTHPEFTAISLRLVT